MGDFRKDFKSSVLNLNKIRAAYQAAEWRCWAGSWTIGVWSSGKRSVKALGLNEATKGKSLEKDIQGLSPKALQYSEVGVRGNQQKELRESS